MRPCCPPGCGAAGNTVLTTVTAFLGEHDWLVNGLAAGFAVVLPHMLQAVQTSSASPLTAASASTHPNPACVGPIQVSLVFQP